MAKGLVFAMENDEVGQVAGDDAGVAQAMVEATDAAQEVAIEAQEIAQAADDTVAAAADAETLEKVQDVVAQTVQSGEGMDETTAQVTQVVVESICNRLGISSNRLMPATESFGSSNTRLAATKVALENAFTDTIKRVWEAIKKFVKSTWEKIKDFFARFFANAEKVKKAAEAMKESANKIAGKKKEKESFDSKSIFTAFAEKGKFDINGVNKIYQHHTKLTNGVSGLATDAAGAIKGLEDALASFSADKKNIKTPIEKAAKAAAKYVNGIFDSSNDKGVSFTEDKKSSNDTKTVKVAKIGGFVGGASLNFVETARKTDPEGVVSYLVEFDARPHDVDGEKKVPTLDAAQMNSICDEVIKLMVLTIDFGKKKSDIEKIGTQLTKTVDGALSRVESMTADDAQEAKEANTLIRDMFNGLNATLTRVYTQIPAWNVKAGKAGLSYCQQSIAQYKDA